MTHDTSGDEGPGQHQPEQTPTLEELGRRATALIFRAERPDTTGTLETNMLQSSAGQGTHGIRYIDPRPREQYRTWARWSLTEAYSGELVQFNIIELTPSGNRAETQINLSPKHGTISGTRSTAVQGKRMLLPRPEEQITDEGRLISLAIGILDNLEQRVVDHEAAAQVHYSPAVLFIHHVLVWLSAGR